MNQKKKSYIENGYIFKALAVLAVITLISHLFREHLDIINIGSPPHNHLTKKSYQTPYLTAFKALF